MYGAIAPTLRHEPHLTIGQNSSTFDRWPKAIARTLRQEAHVEPSAAHPHPPCAVRIADRFSAASHGRLLEEARVGTGLDTVDEVCRRRGMARMAGWASRRLLLDGARNTGRNGAIALMFMDAIAAEVHRCNSS